MYSYFNSLLPKYNLLSYKQNIEPLPLLLPRDGSQSLLPYPLPNRQLNSIESINPLSSIRIKGT